MNNDKTKKIEIFFDDDFSFCPVVKICPPADSESLNVTDSGIMLSGVVLF